MRKFVVLVFAETTLYAGAGFMDWMTQGFPGWIWGIVFLTSGGILIWLYWQEAKQARLVIVNRFHDRQNERISVKEEFRTVVTRPDGTSEERSSDDQ